MQGGGVSEVGRGQDGGGTVCFLSCSSLTLSRCWNYSGSGCWRGGPRVCASPRSLRLVLAAGGLEPSHGRMKTRTAASVVAYTWT